MRTRRFADRREAGQQLAKRLTEYKGNTTVLALPRGGVETAVEIASKLNVPLGLVIARKIGHPGWPEYAIGAVTETGPAIWNEIEKANLDKSWLNQAEAKERKEAKRRREHYLFGNKITPLKGKTVILVDDGIATGLTARAAVMEIQKQKPAQVVVAVPVAPRDVINKLLEEVDNVITLVDPDKFKGAVGAHYDSFPQLSDEEVLNLLY